MRKTIGIVIGCIVLCILVAAMLAVPPPKNNLIVINGSFQTDGVDKPWFELSKGKKETAQWKNETAVPCTVSFGQQTPFEVEPIPVASGNESGTYDAKKAPEKPSKDWPDDKVYKVYKYSITCGNTTFDPGGGILP